MNTKPCTTYKIKKTPDSFNSGRTQRKECCKAYLVNFYTHYYKENKELLRGHKARLFSNAQPIWSKDHYKKTAKDREVSHRT